MIRAKPTPPERGTLLTLGRAALARLTSRISLSTGGRFANLGVWFCPLRSAVPLWAAGLPALVFDSVRSLALARLT